MMTVYESQKQWFDSLIGDGLILPKGIDVIYLPTTEIQLDMFAIDPIQYSTWKAFSGGCDHEYINVGFTSITEVCKKCHKEKN